MTKNPTSINRNELAVKALNLMKLAHAQTAANYQINVIEYRSTIDQLL